MMTTADREIWRQLLAEAQAYQKKEPLLASFYHTHVLRHDDFASALSAYLAFKLGNNVLSAPLIEDLIKQAINDDTTFIASAGADIKAYRQRDPACDNYALPFLHFKGFHALQAYRVAHWLWRNNRQLLALCLRNRMSMVFAVDIHPAANIGHGIMIDHATGVAIGQTAVISNNVSLLHDVCIDGSSDRHTHIADGVLVSAGAKLLGVHVGVGAKIAAGSLVVDDVAPHTTVAGVPAKVVGRPKADRPALDMNQRIDR